MHIDLSANVSPDSQLVLVLCQEEATQESLSQRAAGPSCARMSDDQNEPFSTDKNKNVKKKNPQNVR